MAAIRVLKFSEWVNLLAEITTLAANPPEGCDPVTLPSLTASQKWTVADIAAAQSWLKEICSDNTFTPPDGKWRSSIIDELYAAIGRGWCDCEEEEPCCVPAGGVAAVVDYLRGNISYEQAAAVVGSETMARLQQCVGGPDGQVITYTHRHQHWTNCLYQDRWLDDGSLCPWNAEQGEYWSGCGSEPDEVLDSGYVPALAPDYGGSTVIGEHAYYDQSIGLGYHYSQPYGRWYETRWIGAFDVDYYVYDLSVTNVC